MDTKHVSKFNKALQGQFNKDGKLTGTGEIKYKDAQNKIGEDDFEESIVNKNSEDFKFDCFTEALQEIVIKDEFENMQNSFCEKYYKVFEDKAENKLEYTKIFNEYTKKAEKFLEDNLKKMVPQYNIDDFYKMLESKKFKMDDQLLDTLLNIADFQNFKEMMLAYKRSKTNKNNNLQLGIHVKKAPTDKSGKNIDSFDFLDNHFKQNKGKKK